MQLTVRDVSALLQVPEHTVESWIEDRGLPATDVQGQVRVNRAELLEWATTNRVPIPGKIFRNGHDAGIDAEPYALADALRRGGIIRKLPGRDAASVLRALADRVPVPEPADRELVYRIFLAREKQGSTGIGGGIALPHARGPIVLDLDAPCVTIGFLETPVDFRAADGRPVFAAFALLSPTVRAHLHMLARLGYALQQLSFRSLVEGAAPDPDILLAAEALDRALREKDAGKP